MTEPTKVVTLRGNQPFWAPGDPVPRIVELLEKALAEAKSGNMRAAAIAWTIADGSGTPTVDNDFVASMGHCNALWSEYSRLGRRLAKAMDGE